MAVMNVPNQAPDTSLMQLAQMLEQIKARKMKEGQVQLQTLMELGGTPDPGAIETISKNLGMNPSILNSVMKTRGVFSPTDTDESAIPITEKYFPSRAERELGMIKPKAKAEAEATAEAEPILTSAEVSRGRRLLPLKREEEQQKLDLLFEQEKKKSEKITIPEHRQIALDTLTNEKDLANTKLNIEKQLEQYKRTIQTTPTPKEAAEIEMYNAHSQYYRDMGLYNTTIRGQLQKVNAENKDFINSLKTHNQFMKDNAAKFYDKGKGGKITPHEYDPGSQEETDFLASMDKAGIKYQKSTASHWIGKNKDVFIPVAPEIPQNSTTVEGAMNIKGATKTSVILDNGRTIPRNPDGIVTINGKNYNVEED